MKTLSMGEALIDVTQDGDLVSEHVGGSPLNVAVGLARLGHDTTLATWIGTDRRGKDIAAHLTQSGVALAPGSDSAPRTSVAFATFNTWRKAVYTFDLLSDLADIDTPQDYGHLHAGSIGAVLDPSSRKIEEALRKATGTISYDPNIRPDVMGTPIRVRDQIERLISLSDIVKASDEDVLWLYPGRSVEDTMRAWVQLGASLVVITRGAHGAYILLPDLEMVDMEAQQVTVSDTIGAGDSFMAGLLSGLADAGFAGSAEAKAALASVSFADVEPAIARAIHSAAITVGRVGAYAPTREELD